MNSEHYLKSSIIPLFIVLLIIVVIMYGWNLYIKQSKEGFDITENITMNGPNNEIAIITPQNTIILTSLSGTNITYEYTSSSTSNGFNVKIFTNPTGDNAILILNFQGPVVAQISSPDTTTPLMFYPDISSGGDAQNTTPVTQSVAKNSSAVSDLNLLYASNGDIARIITGDETNLLIITSKDTGNVELYNMDTNIDSNINSKRFTGQNGHTAIYNSIDGADQLQVNYSSSNIVSFTSHQPSIVMDNKITGNNTRNNAADITPNIHNTITEPMSLPIPDDMYILKSSIVPPICPKCPQPIVQCDCNNNTDENNNNSSNNTNRQSGNNNNNNSNTTNPSSACSSYLPQNYSSNYSGAGM